MGGGIAIKRISCTPQKLQAKLAMVQIGRGNWWKVVQAGRRNDTGKGRDGGRAMPAVRPGCSSRRGKDEGDQAAWQNERGQAEYLG